MKLCRACAALAAVAVTLTACSASGDRPSSASKTAPVPYPRDPYPSTYRPYGGVPTLVRNVTVFDGEGHRIDNGAVLFADGKVVAVGASVEAPAGATVIDGQGKYVTPGVIDIHSSWAIIPAPASRRCPTATRRPGRSPRTSGPSTACGRRTPVSAARSPTAA